MTGSEQSVLVLLTANKLYLLDCASNSLQQHFGVEQSKLETKDTSQRGLVEVHLTPHSKSTDKDILSPSNFQTVEYYLQLSQMEAQDLPVAAADQDDSSAVARGDDEKCDTSLDIVLLIDEKNANCLLSTFQSIRSHILEPELSFCVYSSPLYATKEDSFFSVFSHPTD